MGLFDLFTNKTRLFYFEILFSPWNISARVKKLSKISNDEYVRLWAFYEAKIIYNLGGFPNSDSSVLALDTIRQVINQDFNTSPNCFKQEGDIVQRDYSSSILPDDITHIFKGEFFSRDSDGRFITTHFPLKIIDLDIINSGLALMQYVIDKIKDDKKTLNIFKNTAIYFFGLYHSGMGNKISDTIQIPQMAYLKATSK